MTIVPTFGSRIRFSKSAHEAPWIIAPITWFSVVSGLTGRPQSFTETILTTRTSPVSVSTSTSANCVPARSRRTVSYCFGRFAETSISSPLIFAATCLNVSAFAGVAATKIFPFAASSSSAFAPSSGAAIANSCARALLAARRTTGATEFVVTLPPEPGPSGYCVSPMRIVMSRTSSPSSSAATIAIAVR